MSVLVVTGTDTGVGKTVVTAALTTLAAVRGSTVAVVKPAQTGVAPGEPADLDEITRLAGAGTGFEYARYPDPLSPAAAARHSGLPALDLTKSAARISELAEDYRLVLVEGAGGLLVRYDEDGATVADLARLLRAPVLVVVRAGLGTLNQTALTLEVLAHHGIALAGLVIGAWPADPISATWRRSPRARCPACSPNTRPHCTRPSSSPRPGPGWPRRSAAGSMRQTSGEHTSHDRSGRRG